MTNGLGLVGVMLAVLAAFLGTVSLPGAVSAHDDGLTCHEHPPSTGLPDVIVTSYQIHANAGVDPLPVLAFSLVLVVNSDGEANANGTLRIWGDPHVVEDNARAAKTKHASGSQAISVAQPVAAAAECAEDGTLLELTVLFTDRSADTRAELTISPGPRTDRRPWRPAEFLLAVDGHEPVSWDGAILVVTAADGPMP